MNVYCKCKITCAQFDCRETGITSASHHPSLAFTVVPPRESSMPAAAATDDGTITSASNGRSYSPQVTIWLHMPICLAKVVFAASPKVIRQGFERVRSKLPTRAYISPPQGHDVITMGTILVMQLTRGEFSRIRRPTQRSWCPKIFVFLKTSIGNSRGSKWQVVWNM